MSRDPNASLVTFLAGVVTGAAVGAGVALLMAPASGKKTRRRISRAAERTAGDLRGRADDLRERADDLRERADDQWKELSGTVRERVDGAVSGAKRRLQS